MENTSTTVQTYTNAKNAKRAGDKKFGVDGYKIETTEDNKFVIVQNKVKPTTIQGLPYVQFSTIERPCKRVWHIADSMPKASRKEVLKACIDAGIAFYTSRTQYQLWLQTQKDMASQAPAVLQAVNS